MPFSGLPEGMSCLASAPLPAVPGIESLRCTLLHSVSCVLKDVSLILPELSQIKSNIHGPISGTSCMPQRGEAGAPSRPCCNSAPYMNVFSDRTHCGFASPSPSSGHAVPSADGTRVCCMSHFSHFNTPTLAVALLKGLRLSSDHALSCAHTKSGSLSYFQCPLACFLVPRAAMTMSWPSPAA